MPEDHLILFIDPTCEHCVTLLARISGLRLPVCICYMVPTHGATMLEAVIQIAVRESHPAAFVGFVGLRHRDLAWLTGWRSWRRDAEELGLDSAVVEATLPRAVELMIKEAETARILKVPATPALWDGKMLRVGAGCLDNYLRDYGQGQITDNS